MAIYGKEMTICYIAWDSSAGSYKTGDVANHTLRWIKNGVSSAPSNSPSEVDATNAPGTYKVTITATEAQTPFGVLAGKSSTANVVISPVSISFERTPDADPGSAGGIPTADASNRVKSDIEAIDGLTTDSNNATLYLKSLDVQNPTGNAFNLSAPAGTAVSAIGDIGALFDSSSANGSGMNIFGRGNQNALNVAGGDTADGASFSGGSGVGIRGDIEGNITGNLIGSVTGSVAEALSLGAGAITSTVLDDSGLDAIRNKFLVLQDSLNGPTVGANTVTLSSIYAANDDAYNGMFGCHFNALNELIQTFVVTDYVNSPTPTLTVTPNWAIAPVDTDIIRIYEPAVGAVNISSSGSDSILDSADSIETGLTVRGALRIITAALSGKLSGAGTTTVVIRNYGDTKNRITATVDTDGNRTDVTTDVT